VRSIQYLDRVEAIFTRMQVFKVTGVDDEIKQLLTWSFDELVTSNYEDCKEIRLRLFDLAEEHHDWFFASLLALLDIQLRQIHNVPLMQVSQRLQSDGDSDSVSEFFLKLAESLLASQPRGSGIRLSDVRIPTSSVPDELRQPILSLVIRFVQRDGATYKWGPADLQEVLLPLALGREVSLMIDRVDLFYALSGVVIQRLNISQEYQLSRDFAEEILFTSLLDKKPEWGYLSHFQLFNGQNNINMALIYANALE
jgi:hypothetical protein